MAADSELLDRVSAGEETAFVRVYRWSEPTVTLGYFQSPDDSVPAGLAGCRQVRRLTGGGAILHHNEVTYSCILPASHPIGATPLNLYTVVHSAIIKLLGECGVTARLRGDERVEETEPWLCFLRKDPRDIVVGKQKVVGSAQRRRRRNILQHGSVLLKSSALTPQVVGLEDLQPSMNSERFCRELGPAVVSAISR